ncbi:hypothetical protein PRIPAC_87658 [Pristionchus pacificus]|uniref:Uncharacterized protein n=1 Tax=Pristionchus pacificus TaxID=54126 RepID=A0A2A6CTP9_PRIPA|nr:hypothetical protein PRIPAC_87658 [Pristionchus pacificus]|eukprot:PDM81413.1 hypothetical protein PRIPAC_35289 [Pristionchus pacificus]
MSYDKYRAAVFERMSFDNTLEGILAFIDAILVFYTNHPDRPILNENLSNEERQVILRTYYHDDMSLNSQPWVDIQQNLAFLNILTTDVLTTDRLRALLTGCQMLRLDLYPVIYSIREDAVTKDKKYLYNITVLAPEFHLALHVNPSQARDIYSLANDEYALED